MAIHMILQGKGGVGKSLISALLAQYFQSKGEATYNADTDPVNDTFSRYKSLEVETIEIVDDDNNIDTRQFDALIEKLVEFDGQAVIDNGASTFVPLTTYMVDSLVEKIFKAAGKDVIIHTVLTGGQSFQDTLIGLRDLLDTQEAKVVVWINEFFGKVEQDGVTFTRSEVYKEYSDRIHGIVTIEKRNADTHGKDMEMMVSNHLTFAEAQKSSLFSLVPKTRLAHVQSHIFKQLDAIEL